MIRYEFDSPAFDPAAAIKNAHKHLGEPLKPCGQADVEYQVSIWFERYRKIALPRRVDYGLIS